MLPAGAHTAAARGGPAPSAAPQPDAEQLALVRHLRQRLVDPLGREAGCVPLRPALQATHDRLLEMLNEAVTLGSNVSVLMMGEKGVGKTLVRALGQGQGHARGTGATLACACHFRPPPPPTHTHTHLAPAVPGARSSSARCPRCWRSTTRPASARWASCG
jgi:hypothetical protein